MQTFLPESLFAQLEDQESDWAVAQEILEQYELLIDSSEQERERSTDNQEQKKHYSGYKKPSFKNMFIVLPKSDDIVDVALGDPGPKSDISQFREARDKFSQKQQFRGDLGY